MEVEEDSPWLCPFFSKEWVKQDCSDIRCDLRPDTRMEGIPSCHLTSAPFLLSDPPCLSFWNLAASLPCAYQPHQKSCLSSKPVTLTLSDGQTVH